jgi:hypothetical protein
MIEHIKEYDEEIIGLIKTFPVHFTKMIQSKGAKKSKAKDRTYLMDYINRNTPKLNSVEYTLLTKLYWLLNDIEDFPLCSNPDCQKPLIGFNVKTLRYGYVSYCSRSCQYGDKKWRDAVKTGFLEKYGVDNFFKSDKFKQSQYGLKKEVKEKKYETHKRNSSFKESEKENDVYRLLLQKFNKEDIIRQYSDERYPFNCDFYIKSIDTFIEYNGTWTHGNHPFDTNDENDLKTLRMWKDKNTKFYDNAIETWTVRDVNKRKTALDNKLNYIEFWNLGEVRKFVGIENFHSMNNLDFPWDRKRAKYEFDYFKNRDCEDIQKTTSKNNYIIKYFQQDTFFRKEKELWKNDEKIRDRLILNRMKYLNKKEDELTVDELLTGFKKSGIHYGYSHFNPLWFKWFLQKYNIKTCYDPCGGWGHRLLGALNIEKYIYNDLSKSTKENVDRIIDYFGIKNTKTFNEDARKFIPDDDFEAMFTCPPYFNVEEYECGKFDDRKQFDDFMDSLFDVFMKKENCWIFGVVIREDLMIFDDYFEKILLNERNEKYLNNSKNNDNEYLFIFKK